MSDIVQTPPERTAVDDVRAVREKLAREHAGDIRAHVEETNRIAEALRAKLGIRIGEAASQDLVRKGA